MNYIFGTINRNGALTENLKTTGEEHSALAVGEFAEIRREYPDCVITDKFRVDEHYKDAEDTEGNCYDWYAISAHWRNIDKTPAVKQAQDDTDAMVVELTYQVTLQELGVTE